MITTVLKEPVSGFEVELRCSCLGKGLFKESYGVSLKGFEVPGGLI